MPTWISVSPPNFDGPVLTDISKAEHIWLRNNKRRFPDSYEHEYSVVMELRTTDYFNTNVTSAQPMLKRASSIVEIFNGSEMEAKSFFSNIEQLLDAIQVA